MGLVNIILQNERDKVFQRMLSLREETELLIRDNIIAINGDKPYLIVGFLESGFSVSEVEKKGWIEDNGLYDKLVIEYNQQPDRQRLLTRWK